MPEQRDQTENSDSYAGATGATSMSKADAAAARCWRTRRPVCDGLVARGGRSGGVYSIANCLDEEVLLHNLCDLAISAIE
jgi:hypothetical protein